MITVTHSVLFAPYVISTHYQYTVFNKYSRLSFHQAAVITVTHSVLLALCVISSHYQYIVFNNYSKLFFH